MVPQNRPRAQIMDCIGTKAELDLVQLSRSLILHRILHSNTGICPHQLLVREPIYCKDTESASALALRLQRTQYEYSGLVPV